MDKKQIYVWLSMSLDRSIDRLVDLSGPMVRFRLRQLHMVVGIVLTKDNSVCISGFLASFPVPVFHTLRLNEANSGCSLCRNAQEKENEKRAPQPIMVITVTITLFLRFCILSSI